MQNTVNVNFMESKNKVDYNIDILIELMLVLIEMHEDFNDKIIDGSINLKKTQVRNVLNQMSSADLYLIEKNFYSLLLRNTREFDLLTIETDLEYTYDEYDFRLRVKQLDSIIYKLFHYNIEKKEKGSVSLNKCLNDLLGFRICLPNFKHGCEVFEEVCKNLEKRYKIKYRNASKGNYKATHLYFYGESNDFFPWELQIWIPEDFVSNYESHERHKQGYKKSAEIHKNTKGIWEVKHKF